MHLLNELWQTLRRVRKPSMSRAYVKCLLDVRNNHGGPAYLAISLHGIFYCLLSMVRVWVVEHLAHCCTHEPEFTSRPSGFSFCCMMWTLQSRTKAHLRAGRALKKRCVQSLPGGDFSFSERSHPSSEHVKKEQDLCFSTLQSLGKRL